MVKRDIERRDEALTNLILYRVKKSLYAVWSDFYWLKHVVALNAWYDSGDMTISPFSLYDFFVTRIFGRFPPTLNSYARDGYCDFACCNAVKLALHSRKRAVI